jgi:hypothetical protein
MDDAPAACGEIGQYKDCEEVERLEELREEFLKAEEIRLEDERASLEQETDVPTEKAEQAHAYLPLPAAPALVFDDSWMDDAPASCGEIGQYKDCEEVERLEELREEFLKAEEIEALKKAESDIMGDLEGLVIGR